MPKQIKTIVERITWHSGFDDEINRYLADGWTLVHRGVIPSPTDCNNTMLYAELEKGDETSAEFVDRVLEKLAEGKITLNTARLSLGLAPIKREGDGISCETCKYRYISALDHPCCKCQGDTILWEPIG